MFPQTLLFRPTLTRFILSITFLCASLAWGGWVFLHSVGDPHRAERIATEILGSSSARDEIAKPFTDQLVNYAYLDPTSETQLRSVVSDVLADPRIVDNFVAAFGSAQANALGVADPRPSVIDVGLLVDIVREHVAVQFPELASKIPASTEKIEIPKVKTNAVADLRRLADTWTIWLALISLTSLVALMIFGDRRVVLRSFGIWAILTGAFWAIGPRLVPWLAHSYAPQADGIVKATVDAVSTQITTTATILVVCGILALIARAVFFGRDYVPRAAAPAPATAAAYDPAFAGGPYQAAPLPQPFGQSGPPTVPAGYAFATMQQPATAGYPQQPSGGGWPPEPTSQVPAQVSWSTQPGYAQPGYAQPGYAQPGHAQPGHAQPGYGQPDSSPSTPASHAWPSNIPQPAPILLRPLDLPSSSDALYPLANSDDPSGGS